jgi:phosphoesterase RecJ-like protein
MSAPVFIEQQLQALKSLLSTPKSVVITTHHKPDGDALGSTLGLKAVLESLGHRVTAVLPSEFPMFLSWMSGADQCVDFLQDSQRARSVLRSAELLFCLDFNDPSRVEKMEGDLLQTNCTTVLIDHHLDPKPGFGHLQFSYPSVASTCELLVHLLLSMKLDGHLNRDSAEALYCGIMTDTGSFRFNSVTAATHRVVARLMEEGVRNDDIHAAIYDTSSVWRMRFLGYTLHEKMQVLEEYKTVIFTATQSDMNAFHHASGDLEGIVNYGLAIRGMQVAVFFSERDGVVKISFRSKGVFSVKEIAEKHFEGGGHRNAAGGRSSLSLEKTVEKFIALLPAYNPASNEI